MADRPSIVALERVLGEPGLACPTCHTEMVVTVDAIGRTRDRCPRCHGVSKRRPVHPDAVLIPQTLVIKPHGALPAIAPGQLRCQSCAKAVVGRARLCPACQLSARTAPVLPHRPRLVAVVCDRCQQPVQRIPSRPGRTPKCHDACLTASERKQRDYNRTSHERRQARG